MSDLATATGDAETQVTETTTTQAQRDAQGRFVATTTTPAPETQPAAQAATTTEELPVTETTENSVLRQMREQLRQRDKEIQAYKRSADEQRRAQMTEEQRIREEASELRKEVEQLRIEQMQSRIGAEFRLPASLIDVLRGTDEEAMRLHATELARLLPKPQVSQTNRPASESPTARVYKRSELRADPKLARSPEVQQALREGRISTD